MNWIGVFKLLVAIIFIILLPFNLMQVSTFVLNPRLNTSQNRHKYAIVFGASVLPTTKPSAILQKRLDRALILFQQKKVENIIVTGDNRDQYYNEPKAMRRYLIENGVPQEHVLIDPEGLRTLNSCNRAKSYFQLNDAVLVTQAFHLPRSQFLCKVAGIETTPVSAQDVSLETTLYGTVREIPASWLALKDIIIDSSSSPE